MYRAMGSLAFVAAARSSWIVTKDPESDRRRLFLPIKNNIGNDRDGLAYSLVNDDQLGQARVVWRRDVVNKTADEALAAESGEGSGKPGPEPKARNAAKDWLVKLLAGGAVEAAKVKAEAKAAAMTWRTVQRAADDLGVIREKSSFSEGWQWRLALRYTGGDPKDATEDAKSSQALQLGILAPSAGDPENAAFPTPSDEDAKLKIAGTFEGEREEFEL